VRKKKARNYRIGGGERKLVHQSILKGKRALSKKRGGGILLLIARESPPTISVNNKDVAHERRAAVRKR